jgi:hypothetical protein
MAGAGACASKPAKTDQLGTALNATSSVHLQQGRSCAPDGREANDLDAAQRKMRRPYVSPWMKQKCDLASGGIDSGEVGSLVAIASMACPPEILEVCLTAMLSGDDVLEVEGFERRQPVRQVTVFTAPSRALANLLTQRLGHLIRARIAAGARPLAAARQ